MSRLVRKEAIPDVLSLANQKPGGAHASCGPSLREKVGADGFAPRRRPTINGPVSRELSLWSQNRIAHTPAALDDRGKTLRHCRHAREDGLLVKQSLGLDEAKLIGEAALTAARTKGLAVAIAVVGEATYLQYFVSLDGAGYWAGEGAIEKARSAAEGGHPTTFFEKPLNAGRFSMVKMRHMALEGGLPLIIDGKCVGAIGVSGAPPHEDAAIAQAGVAAFAPQQR